MNSFLVYDEFLDNTILQMTRCIYRMLIFSLSKYSMLLYHLHWLSDLDYGRKGKERCRWRMTFSKKVGSKLSDYFFQKIY